MVKNKIYNYFLKEIFKSFITILFAFSIIAWTVRSVNFLELIVDDGHSLKTYLYFSALNITNIIAKFMPLSFLLALNLSIIKFEKQNELIILWTTGVKKIKVINLFFLISLFILILQIIFSVFITPGALNKSRYLVKESTITSFNILVKSNNFSDSLKRTTVFVEKINPNNELETIFIRDESNTFQSLVNENGKSSNLSIFAKKGVVKGKSLVLENGVIQSLNEKGKLSNIEFDKTVLYLDNISTRTISEPKMQETSTLNLLNCLDKFSSFTNNYLSNECKFEDGKKEVFQNISRRIGMPLYIPLVSLITCLLLVSNLKKRKRVINTFSVGLAGFLILVLAEIFLRYTGNSKFNTLLYFLFPLALVPIMYIILFVRSKKELN
ncbi:MAG: hypothetical protein CL687_02130 [Candidatus Pelagibacter sp.]|nr:hypothetical protein [Candidatus Pelagibacter sp.]MAJ85755.1 hypothetical protein [Candidatus Pelagibacter sp.]|tara:strand:- start:3502 stop:4647 length:1146 start_codon:yes stop_codon:yes gene_type:complete